MAKTYIMTEYYEVCDVYKIEVDEEKFEQWKKDNDLSDADAVIEDYIMEEIMDNDWENNKNVKLITDREQVGELQQCDFQLVKE